MNDLKDLFQAPKHECPHCGKVVIGDIPFKIHQEKCGVRKKIAKLKKEKAKIRPSKELVRILRGKLLK